MKVWELMAQLAPMPANAEVVVTDRPNGTFNTIDREVYTEDGNVFIVGNGVASADNEKHTRRR